MTFSHFLWYGLDMAPHFTSFCRLSTTLGFSWFYSVNFGLYSSCQILSIILPRQPCEPEKQEGLIKNL